MKKMINAKVLSLKEEENGFFYKFNEEGNFEETDTEDTDGNVKRCCEQWKYTQKPNEARRYLDMPDDPDGDKLIVNGNYIPLEKVGNTVHQRR